MEVPLLMLSGIRSSWGLNYGQSRRLHRADQIGEERILRRGADRDLRSAVTPLHHAPLSLPARDFIPGRTPGTLSNSNGANGRDGL